MHVSSLACLGSKSDSFFSVNKNDQIGTLAVYFTRLITSYILYFRPLANVTQPRTRLLLCELGSLGDNGLANLAKYSVGHENMFGGGR